MHQIKFWPVNAADPLGMLPLGCDAMHESTAIFDYGRQVRRPVKGCRVGGQNVGVRRGDGGVGQSADGVDPGWSPMRPEPAIIKLQV
ncbi:hypothetical protein CCHR01_19359 [Colletotrichum chrysophilum]|uniref:Uncharacterized protein n=1 Tax=Colletotrichum chrysophilum TaxID=1836956 RepID=A0AAD8ZYM0_9PEZI|nr:hypothetical protein CCHR01_19359 [Colletotrichum chrysophilum]